jgi:hypothetical protein
VGQKRYVWLSRLIEEVTAYDATITRFYLTSCRAVLEDPNPALKNVGPRAYKAAE